MRTDRHALRVLVVEDHGDTRRVLSTLLDRWGFDVSAAESLGSGLAFVDAKEFDVIVTDIALPDGTGFALVTEAKRKRNDLRAIAISGYHSAADIEIGKMSGFDYHLTKPFDCHALRTILNEFSASKTSPAGENQTSFGSDGAAS